MTLRSAWWAGKVGGVRIPTVPHTVRRFRTCRLLGRVEDPTGHERATKPYRRRSTLWPRVDCGDAGICGVLAESNTVIQFEAVELPVPEPAAGCGVPAASSVVSQLGELDTPGAALEPCHPRSASSRDACWSAGLTPLEPIPPTTHPSYNHVSCSSRFPS